MNASLTHCHSPAALVLVSQANNGHTNNEAVTCKQAKVTDDNFSTNYKAVECADKKEDLQKQLVTLGIDKIPHEQLQ